MASRIRWGLLSTARINRALIPPITSLPRHSLRAVASRDAATAKAYAAEWDIPVSYGSYEALLADPEIDAIYNPLPNGLHAEWTIRAAQAGKHVLCEKPLALSVAEVDRIEAAASANDVVVTEAFMYRHHPQTMQLKELLDSGTIGDVLVIRGAFTFTLTRPGDVRLDADMGGGSLWDVGCYPVSMARYLTGREPSRVVGWQRTAPSGIDDVFVGMLDFDGTLAQFDCGFAAPFRTELEIVGTTGAISVPVPFKPGENEQLFISRGGEREVVPVEGQALYAGEVEDMADAILHGTAPRISLAHSRGNTATLVALYESARTRQPVTLR
jgi:D-xylose 1-dehydrogenase (NADP+, D-xylono-1,5-lactone-forming)